MTIVTFTIAAGCLIFVLISLLIPLASLVRLPLSVVIAIVGLSGGALVWATGFEFAGKGLDTYDLWFVQSLALDTHSLLVIFLPPLLFEMSLGVSPRRLRDDVWVVLLMAVIAVLLATVIVGVAVWQASTMSLLACLLLGAAISTTDPAAVVTTFREIGAPRRLRIILEGESLLNDAAAIALFTLLVGIARADAVSGPFALATSFLYGFSSGAAAGVAIAWLASRVYPLLGGSVVAEATLTVALAHGSYLIAELGLGASGVVAVVFAGMTTRHVGLVTMGPKNWSTVFAVWTQIGFWANALILLLSAMLAPRMLAGLKSHDVLLIAVTFAGAFVARAVVLFLLLPVLSHFRLTTPMNLAQQTLAWWGGVRGAVTLILALSLAEISSLPEMERNLIAAVGAGFVFATLLVNASTLELATRTLGLNRLSLADLALKARIVAGTREQIRSFVEDLARERSIEPEAIRDMRKTYDRDVADALKVSGEAEIEFGERLRLGLSIICNQELRLVQTAFEEGAIGPRVTRILRTNAEDLADAARTDGRDAYESAMQQQLDAAKPFRLALLMQRLLKWDRPLRDQLGYHVTMLLESEANLRDLLKFSETTLPTMVGGDAAANLCQLVEERRHEVRRMIEAIALQYPHYTENMERILLLRAAARRERSQYDWMLEDEVIGSEIHKSLVDELDDKWKQLQRPPNLDLGLSPIGLLNQVPLFAEIGAKHQQTIAGLLEARVVMPGETIVAEGERGHAMYFIASGVVEVNGLSEEVHLSNGDFFGELSLLAPTRRRTTSLVAITVCRLLVLDQRDFRRLMASVPEIESRIRAAAERQLGEGFTRRTPEEIEQLTQRAKRLETE